MKAGVCLAAQQWLRRGRSLACLHKPLGLGLGAGAVGVAAPGAAAGRGPRGEARPRRRAQHRRRIVHCRRLRVPAHSTHPVEQLAQDPVHQAGSYAIIWKERPGKPVQAYKTILSGSKRYSEWHAELLMAHRLQQCAGSLQCIFTGRMARNHKRRGAHHELIWLMYWPGLELGEAPAAPQLRLMLSRSCCCSACRHHEYEPFMHCGHICSSSNAALSALPSVAMITVQTCSWHEITAT